MLNNKTYDRLRYIAQIVLPGLGTLYFALATIWNLPYGEQIVGTITAVDAFLGCLLGISTSKYNKVGGDGTMVIDTSDPDKDVYRMELNEDAGVLSEKDKVTFRVEKK